MSKLIKVIGAIAMASILSSCARESSQPTKFTNSDIVYKTSMSSIWDMTKAYWNNKNQFKSPEQPIPVLPLSKQALLGTPQDTVWRLGHSTLLIKLNEQFVLIDPVFSERASFVQWFGPKRFHASPISIDDLPPISAVIISHDHYDHLDEHSIKQLTDKVDLFITPLKVGNHLIEWGVAEDKVVQLDWWQNKTLDGIEFIATPAQHFSGRGLFDRDHTLWASWVIKTNNTKFFFSGDSGYFDGFKEIGERFGPFDITMIETGAYNDLWSEIHMLPEQSVQAHIDLRGKQMLPIHNGTFDLSLHNWFEPFERVAAEAEEQWIDLLTPKFGEPVAPNTTNTTSMWWKALMPAPERELSLQQQN
jgi:L-ascorbate metabolism protein UlaG (beta-lactamase superfamily)